MAHPGRSVRMMTQSVVGQARWPARAFQARQCPFATCSSEEYPMARGATKGDENGRRLIGFACGGWKRP
jgi:hypothetical protein